MFDAEGSFHRYRGTAKDITVANATMGCGAPRRLDQSPSSCC